MPIISLKNSECFYEEKGSGAKTIVFAHGLLWSHKMFHYQTEFLSKNFRTIAFDFAGQGKSISKNNKYDMDTLYEDAAELIEKLCGKSVIFIGLSMGGYVGIRLATRRPDLIEKLILMESSSESEAPENVSKYKMLNNLVRTVGYWPVEKQIMTLMFGNTFLTDKSRKDKYLEYLSNLKENNRFTITKATEGVINRKSVGAELKLITCPTLVVVGEEDKPAPVEKSMFLHENIVGSKLEIIKKAGHTGTLEEPHQYNKVISQFIES